MLHLVWSYPYGQDHLPTLTVFQEEDGRAVWTDEGITLLERHAVTLASVCVHTVLTHHSDVSPLGWMDADFQMLPGQTRVP